MARRRKDGWGRFRARIGPFTFGSTGTRLSWWKRKHFGISVPLSGKGRAFGRVRFPWPLGFLRWFF